MEMTTSANTESVTRPLRLGFVGAGRIGRSRMAAIVAGGAGEAVAVWDPAESAAGEARAIAPAASFVSSYEEMLALPLDGVVIATPTALHAEQARAALSRGMPVFCQKPLGRTAGETRSVIDAARNADVLLGIDLPYRHTEAMRVLRSTVQAGELGDIFAIDVLFHNAYGPDSAWARDPAQAGGGCVIDPGLHIVDLALWTLGFPRITHVSSRLFARGEKLGPGRTDVVEDYATALLDLDTGATIQLACSWDLPAGQDARIEATFYGTEGGGTFRNLNGSLYEFTAELFRGTHRHTLSAPPDDWGGRAVLAWCRAVAAGRKYDPWIEGVADVSGAVDRILGR